MTKKKPMQAVNFYELFNRNNETHLLRTQDGTAMHLLRALREAITTQKQFENVTWAFNKSKVDQPDWMRPEDKDLHNASTYERCYRLHPINNTQIEIIMYSGDNMHGLPENVSSFCTRLKIQSAFTVTDKSGKLVKKLFKRYLEALSLRLIEKEQDLAYQNAVNARKKVVLRGLEQGDYNEDVGVSYFDKHVKIVKRDMYHY
jgi:hypothetical protein